MKIFDSYHLGEEVPKGFDAVRIPLDAQMSSDLDWSVALDEAQKKVDEGYRIFWDLDFGLFNQLSYPIGNETQFLSLSLAINHFLDTVWSHFQDHTLGVNLYRGTIDYTECFEWDVEQEKNLQTWLQETVEDAQTFYEETGCEVDDFNKVKPESLLATRQGSWILGLFCHDVCSDYLSLLRERFPDEMMVFCLLDAQVIQNPAYLMQLLNPEKYARIHLAVRGGDIPIQEYAWSSGKAPQGAISRVPLELISRDKVNIGVCLPDVQQWKPSLYSELAASLSKLTELSISYRLISEEKITYDWDGLDYLVVLSSCMTRMGKRKLLGFCAAGGTILTIGKKMDLPLEEYFSINIMHSKSAI